MLFKCQCHFNTQCYFRALNFSCILPPCSLYRLSRAADTVDDTREPQCLSCCKGSICRLGLTQITISPPLASRSCAIASSTGQRGAHICGARTLTTRWHIPERAVRLPDLLHISGHICCCLIHYLRHDVLDLGLPAPAPPRHGLCVRHVANAGGALVAETTWQRCSTYALGLLWQ